MAYTSNKKINGLDSAVTPLGAGNEIVLSQAGNTVKTNLASVEAKIFDAKAATDNPTGTEVVVVRQTDNNLRQVALADIVPAGNIVDAKISASAAIADTKLATINTAGKVTNNAVQAVSTNTANRIVTRDGSGNFAANAITATTFTGTLAGSATGNAGTATVLATGRTIALTGDVTGTTGSFNGSANVSAATTIANNAVTTAKIADANVTNVKIASGVDAAKLTTGTIPAARIGSNAIDAAKIASNAVTNVKIASGVDAAKLTTGTLPIARIADGAVTNAKLATGIDAAKLTTGTLPAARIGSNAITTARIADGAVTNAKLSLNANDGEIKKALNANNTPPIFACRAWVNFDGTAGSTVDGEFRCTIRGSGNVSKVVRTATGTFVVHFSTAMPDNDYCVFAMPNQVVLGNRSSGITIRATDDSAMGTANVTIDTGSSSSGGAANFTVNCVSVFR